MEPLARISSSLTAPLPNPVKTRRPTHSTRPNLSSSKEKIAQCRHGQSDSSKIREFLGLRRNTTLLLLALVFAGTGEKLWLGFVPKYLETLGGTVLVIGIFDALQTLLGALYAYPGGWLTDHWGERRSLMLFSV